VAAGLLAEAGYDVVGVTMKMYAPTRPAHAKSCCGADDFDDARRSAAMLGISHYVLDFEEAFRRGVIDRFASDYARAARRTHASRATTTSSWGPCAPMPTGWGTLRRHRPLCPGRACRDGPHLYRSDSTKDQSYALAQLEPAQLSRLLLRWAG